MSDLIVFFYQLILAFLPRSLSQHDQFMTNMCAIFFCQLCRLADGTVAWLDLKCGSLELGMQISIKITDRTRDGRLVRQNLIRARVFFHDSDLCALLCM